MLNSSKSEISYLSMLFPQEESPTLKGSLNFLLYSNTNSYKNIKMENTNSYKYVYTHKNGEPPVRSSPPPLINILTRIFSIRIPSNEHTTPRRTQGVL